MPKNLLRFLPDGAFLFLLENEIKAEALNLKSASKASENEATIHYPSIIFK